MIIFSFILLRFFNNALLISSEEYIFMKQLLINFLLPISMIVGVIVNVEYDRKKTKLKRSSYKFNYFIFIPFIIFIALHSLWKIYG